MTEKFRIEIETGANLGALDGLKRRLDDVKRSAAEVTRATSGAARKRLWDLAPGEIAGAVGARGSYGPARPVGGWIDGVVARPAGGVMRSPPVAARAAAAGGGIGSMSAGRFGVAAVAGKVSMEFLESLAGDGATKIGEAFKKNWSELGKALGISGGLEKLAGKLKMVTDAETIAAGKGLEASAIAIKRKLDAERAAAATEKHAEALKTLAESESRAAAEAEKLNRELDVSASFEERRAAARAMLDDARFSTPEQAEDAAISRAEAAKAASLADIDKRIGIQGKKLSASSRAYIDADAEATRRRKRSEAKFLDPVAKDEALLAADRAAEIAKVAKASYDADVSELGRLESERGIRTIEANSAISAATINRDKGRAARKKANDEENARVDAAEREAKGAAERAAKDAAERAANDAERDRHDAMRDRIERGEDPMRIAPGAGTESISVGKGLRRASKSGEATRAIGEMEKAAAALSDGGTLQELQALAAAQERLAQMAKNSNSSIKTALAKLAATTAAQIARLEKDLEDFKAVGGTPLP